MFLARPTKKLEVWITQQRFCILHIGNRGILAFEQILCFTNSLQTVEIMVSKMDAACAPIFQFLNTTVMNFISTDCIFCAYPHLTFGCLLMVDLGPIS